MTCPPHLSPSHATSAARNKSRSSGECHFHQASYACPFPVAPVSSPSKLLPVFGVSYPFSPPRASPPASASPSSSPPEPLPPSALPGSLEAPQALASGDRAPSSVSISPADSEREFEERLRQVKRYGAVLPVPPQASCDPARHGGTRVSRAESICDLSWSVCLLRPDVPRIMSFRVLSCCVISCHRDVGGGLGGSVRSLAGQRSSARRTRRQSAWAPSTTTPPLPLSSPRQGRPARGRADGCREWQRRWGGLKRGAGDGSGKLSSG